MARYTFTTFGDSKKDGGLLDKINGQYVNLAGKDISVTIPQTKSKPKHERVYKAATDEQIAVFIARGQQKIFVPPVAKAAPKADDKK